jgi:hypothetical protein
MKLEGKSLEMFEAWFSDPLMCCNGFNNLSNSMKYGVLVDFFDSVGIHIHINLLEYGFDEKGLIHDCEIIINDEIFERGSSRAFAREQAISKAMEILNDRK